MDGLTILLVCSALAFGETRKAPADPVILQSSRVQVILDRQDGLPFEYLMRWNGARMRGEDSGQRVQVTMFRGSPRAFEKVEGKPASVEAGSARADFHFDSPAASFTLRYALDGATLQVSVENVQE